MMEAPLYNHTSLSSMAADTGKHEGIISDFVFSLIVILISLCSWQGLSKWISTSLTPSIVRQNRTSWRWKNISISFIHSLLTGSWALVCVYRDPKIVEDVVSTYDRFSMGLIAVSLGYFIHDTIDLFRNKLSRQAAELFLHHGIILLCFSISMVTQLYIGYAVVAMIVEINSIFLHARQLLQIVKVPRDSTDFRLVSLLNLGTFIIFRITPIAWMTRWMSQNRDHPLVPFVFYTIGCTSLAIMTVINIVLLYRLINSDFLQPPREPRESDENCLKTTTHYVKND